MRTADEIDILEMKVRGLEHECRALRATLRDKFYQSALSGLLFAGYDATDAATVRLAWHIAAESVRQRQDQP